MIIFDGKKAAQEILDELRQKISAENLRPVLAVILVGNDEASKLYVRLKKEAGAKIGADVREYLFDAPATQEEILAKIRELNDDNAVQGIILQLPLPAVFNQEHIIAAISPQKDVDGFHPENRKMLAKGGAHFLPVLCQAIAAALEAAGDVSGKRILALVNSEIFGQTLKTFLEKRRIEFDFLVRNTCIVFGAEKEMKQADILISVCGCPRLIKGAMIKDGAILIDGGVTRYYDGRIVGDVDQESVAGRAAFLTPVPGGIGPLTVALLLRNVYLAAQFRH